MTEPMARTRTLPTPKPSRLVGAPPGPRQREQRFGALLDAASDLFVEKGVGGTSIDDIAERAGVAKGTFYHYFQDRAAMLSALRMRYSQHFADAAETAIGACGPEDWRAQLDAWTGTVVREYVASYALHDAIFHEPSISHRCVMSEEAIVRKLGTLLEDGERADVWSVECPLMAAVCMFHAVHGLVDEVIAIGSDTETVAPYLSRMFWNMVHPA